MFWPVFLLATPFVVLELVQGMSAWAGLAAGAVLGTPQLLGSVVRFNRPMRAAVKALGGCAVAMAVLSIVWLPVAWPWRASLYVLMAAAFSVLMVVRVRAILRTCHACPWQRDWEHCPGFRTAPSPPQRAGQDP